MDIERRKEIKDNAQQINDFSEQFQLLHATYASQEYVKSTVQGFFRGQLEELKAKITEKANKGLNTDSELEAVEKLESLVKQKRFIVDIGYISISDENIARVTKNGKVFSIYIAKSLKDKIHKPDGRINYPVVKKIRELMAHELGHIVLHTREILAEEGTQGTLNIKNTDKEEEARLFAGELLELRRERNKKIREDGGADRLL